MLYFSNYYQNVIIMGTGTGLPLSTEITQHSTSTSMK